MKIKTLGFILTGSLTFDLHAIEWDWPMAIEGFFDISLDDSLGLGTSSTEGDRLAHVMAKGDFNNDGYEDLAIGVPFLDISLLGFVADDVGAVLIINGSDDGLEVGAGSDNQLLFQTFEANQDGVEADDKFGWALTVGDYNGDGFDDLVVGTPFEDVFQVGILNAGALNVFLGSSEGLESESLFLHQGSGVASDAFVEPLDQFGMVLTSGNFNGDEFDDLVVGVPLEDLGESGDNEGVVYVYLGGNGGIDPDDVDRFHQNTFNVEGDAEEGDLFGWSLAAGDFDDDGLDDLAVGVPGQDLSGEANAGEVHIFSGSLASGVSRNDYFRSQAGPVNGVVEAGDELGHSLAAGDINGDDIDDLVIGVWKEDANQAGLIDIGGINVLYGSEINLSEAGDQFISQNNASVTGTATNTDRFGERVWVDDLNHDGFADVVVGTPNDIGFTSGADVGPVGSMTVFYSNGTAVSLNGEEYLVGSELDQDFGWSIISGRFGPFVELVTGIPGMESGDGDLDAGAVRVHELTRPDLIFENGFQAIQQ